MLPSYANNKERKYIINFLEIVLLFTIFLLVLISLYPKENLEKKVLLEKSNYDLTAIYLKNLIKLNPKDSDLVFAMAKNLHQQEKLDLSLNLLDVLKSNPDEDVKSKAMLLHLELNNKKLKKPISSKERSLIIQQNRKLLFSISQDDIQDSITDRNSSKTLYYTALSLNEKKLALKFNLKIVEDKTDKKHIFWLKNAHYLAGEIKDKEEDINILKTLVVDDTNSSSFWLDALLEQLDNNSDLESLAYELKLKDEELAKLYIHNNQSLKASQIYTSLLKKEENKDVKKELLLKVISILQSNNKTAEAALLISNYEDDYILDKEMTKKFLKLYLSANKADLAKNLSLKIIKKGIRR